MISPAASKSKSSVFHSTSPTRRLYFRLGWPGALTSSGGDAGQNSLNSSNSGLTVDEHGENPIGNDGRLNDDIESRDWIRVLADRAGEARQSAGNSAVWGGARVERSSGTREDSEDEEGWVVDTWVNWLARERISTAHHHWRRVDDWRRRWGWNWGNLHRENRLSCAFSINTGWLALLSSSSSRLTPGHGTSREPQNGMEFPNGSEKRTSDNPRVPGSHAEVSAANRKPSWV